MATEIPVYLFTGFLEAGKTKFLQETLCDPKFNKGQRILVLLCEEGEEELDPGEFSAPNVFVERIDEESDLTPDRLSARVRRHKAEQILVEYNGMWQLNSFYYAMPDDWMIYQQIVFADATTIASYNANMRSLVVDKIQNTDLVVFNRCEKDADFMPLHKLVRGLSRQCNILYEAKDGSIQYDEIEDPLPFDVNAPIVVIEDKDFALWMRDLTEDFEKYEGKVVRFKGVIAKDAKMPKDTIVIGRHIMTCCEADIAYNGLACIPENASEWDTYAWAIVTAEVKIEKHRIYSAKGPVLHALKMERCDPLPENERVATYY